MKKLHQALRAGALGVAGLAMLSTTLPALAAPETQAATLKLYMHKNFQGLMGEFWNPVERRVLASAAHNDEMTSWQNFTQWDGAWYFNGGFDGECHPMPSGHQVSQLPWHENDEMSSFKLGSSCS